MKMKWIISASVATTLCAFGVPQSSVVCHGLVKDAYGNAYSSNARLAFVKATAAEADAHEITGLTYSGENFEVSFSVASGIDSSSPSHYVAEGEELQLVLTVDGKIKPLLTDQIFVVPEAGDDVELLVQVGSDVDGDGMPDEWENQVVQYSGGSITNISQVTPNGDADGDGASNLQEYLAGTYAFMGTDIFALEELERTDNGRLVYEFLSVYDKSYRVQTRCDWNQPDSGWESCSFAQSQEGAVTSTGLIGNGDYQTLYIESEEDKKFLRVVAE